MANVFHKISIVIELINSYTRMPVIDNKLSVTLGNGAVAVPKPRGYYIFTNLEHGQYIVTIEGRRYQKTAIIVDYTSDEVETYHVELVPDVQFFGMQPVTSLTGCLQKTDTSDIRTVSVLVEDKENRLRLKMDGKKGDTHVTFLGSDELLANRRLGTIKKSDKSKEISVLNLGEMQPDGYRLLNPLSENIARANTYYYLIYTVQVQSDGSFYIPIPLSKLIDVICNVWEGENYSVFDSIEVTADHTYKVTLEK